MLLVTAPFLAAAALAVKLDDGGPVLYRQARVTRGGRVFRIMKLRTMTVDAERGGAVWAAKQDPRVTRIGRFLRRTRLDELPQLFNVLAGDMSFVGPRPERPEFTTELAAALPLYNERHLVRAGLSGWGGRVCLRWLVFGGWAVARGLVLGLVGIGTMGTNALRYLLTLYRFKEIRCTSRRPETREAFCRKWSAELGIPVIGKDTIEEVVRGADIAVGGTTSSDVMTRAEWLKPGATFVSLARRELDPAGWASMDKVVIDSWTFNIIQKEFKRMVEAGQFTREQLHGEIQDVISGAKPGREREDERILVHTTGLVSQDVMMAHIVHQKAKARGGGMRLPAAG
jgi:hypothetical protein